MGLTDNDEVLSLITAILWLSNPASTQLGLPVSPVGRARGQRPTAPEHAAHASQIVAAVADMQHCSPMSRAVSLFCTACPNQGIEWARVRNDPHMCGGSTMDIDTSRSMSSEAAKYLRYAKQCAKAAERTTDPKVRERLLKVVADLTAAALSAALGATTPPKSGPSRAA
jgi:hypothetical protein